MAITFAHLRKGIGRLALALAAATFLFACPTRTSDKQTTQEVYTMTTSDPGPSWPNGVIFTVSVKIDKDPGTYNFYFDFVDGASGTVPDAPGTKQVIVN
jgi:hypothetical protein